MEQSLCAFMESSVFLKTSSKHVYQWSFHINIQGIWSTLKYWHTKEVILGHVRIISGNLKPSQIGNNYVPSAQKLSQAAQTQMLKQEL